MPPATNQLTLLLRTWFGGFRCVRGLNKSGILAVASADIMQREFMDYA